MYDLLRSNIEAKVKLKDEEFELIKKSLRHTSLKRKHNLLRKGEVCSFFTFVNQGCLRAYSVDSKEGEQVIQIALEGHWIADLSSFFSGRPGTMYIEALEPSEVLLLNHDALEKLYYKVPALERFFRILFSKAYVATLERLNQTQSIPAKERYKLLLDTHPNVARRVPLIHIASYLGITPESLSRIRKQLAS